MVIIVVFHQKDKKRFKPFIPYALRRPSEKVLISRFVERKNRKRDCSV